MFTDSFEKVAVSGFKWGQAVQNFASKAGVGAATKRVAESGANMASKGYSKSLGKMTGSDAARGLSAPRVTKPSGGSVNYSGFKAEMKSKQFGARQSPINFNPKPTQKTPYGMQNVQKRLPGTYAQPPD